MGSVKTMMGSGLSGLAAQSIHGGTFATGLTAAGSSSTDALQLVADFNVITSAAASTGVKLPNVEVGSSVVVVNGGANAISVYPPTSGQVNNATATTGGIVVGDGKAAICVRGSATHWALIGQDNA